jgi:hypothetical protein
MRQVIGQHQHRDHRAGEQGEAAAQRDDALVHPPASRPVDRTEAPCDPRSRTVQQECEYDPEGERLEGELRAVIHVTPL